ncbi:hypothetical protein D3C83_137100 [compost metagenome]
MAEKKAKLSRRNFLLTMGAGGAAPAAAIVATKNNAPAPATSGKDKRATRGYQVSEHINNYYRTTKV